MKFITGPSSAALMADFASSSPYGAHLDVNIPGCSIPLFWADGTTPTYSVFADVGGDGWTGTNGMNATAMMPIPNGAAPEAVCDRHLAIVDQQRALEWGCYNMRMGSGGWIADLCATADLAGTGVRPPAPAQPWQAAHGARACGFPLIAGLIRTEEIAAGRIDHALVVAYPHIRAGAFTPPASTPSVTGVPAPNGIPCGGRIQFDPTIDVTTLGLSRSGQIIVRALQEYGAYVGD